MKKVNIGGQALIEGIMMKGPEKTALAVRTPDRSISVEYMHQKHLRDRYPIFGWPVIRGVVNFVESMLEGYRALMISADKSGFTDLENEVSNAHQASPPSEKKHQAVINVVMICGAVLGVALSIFLFTYLPALLFDGVMWASGGALPGGIRPLFEGVLKISLFLLYVALVSKTKDIRRVFMYHGAEHKSIFCLEKGLELTVDNVKKQSRFHPRCGTSFMILMLVVGILVGFLLITLFPALKAMRWLWVAIKILMIPLICGLGYEIIRFCGRYDNLLTRVIAAPGLWMQRLTTEEPEEDMIEVAITALKAVLPEEGLPEENSCGCLLE